MGDSAVKEEFKVQNLALPFSNWVVSLDSITPSKEEVGPQ